MASSISPASISTSGASVLSWKSSSVACSSGPGSSLSRSPERGGGDGPRTEVDTSSASTFYNSADLWLAAWARRLESDGEVRCASAADRFRRFGNPLLDRLRGCCARGGVQRDQRQ